MTVNDRDVAAMVYLAERLREETRGANKWDKPGIETFASKLTGHPLHTALERVVRHAADPNARTPAAILRPFTPASPGPQPAFPPKAEDACEHHPGGWKDSCTFCAADRNAGEKRQERRKSRSKQYHDQAEKMRRLKAEAAARLCSCGVPRENCVEHRSTPVEEPPSTGSNERTPA